MALLPTVDHFEKVTVKERFRNRELTLAQDGAYLAS